MAKFQSFWNLASDATRPDVLNMYVYGKIVSSSHWLFGSDTDVVTSQFVKDLQKYPEAKRINVYINSPGGDVFAAAAIRNQLRKHTAEVHSYIDGIGASAAVGLATGADDGNVHMSRSALIMIHNPATRVEGEVKDLAKGIEILQKVKATIISIYQEKTGISEDKLEALMDEESWFTADEALSLNFIDKIVEDEGLVVENITDGILINKVPFSFVNSSPVMAQGNLIFSNTISKTKLEAKLNQVKTQQGGNAKMDFESIFNGLEDDEQAVLTLHIQNAINEAVAAKQTEWLTEKQGLMKQIEDLKTPPADENSEEAILNALPEKARELVIQARKDAAEAKNKLEAAQKAEALATFTNKLKETYASLPFEETHINALYKVATTDETAFSHLENLLKISNAAMAAGFKPVGDDTGKSVTMTTLDEINDKVKILRDADNKLDYNSALRQVFNDNPELYSKYRNEK